MSIEEQVDKIIEKKEITDSDFRNFVTKVVTEGQADPVLVNDQILRLQNSIDAGDLKVI